MTTILQPGGRWLAGIAAVIVMLVAATASGDAASPPKGRTINNCFWELARGQGADLVCDYPAWLADKERAELRRITRDTLQDAHCTVSIRIARHLVARALTEADHTFQAPPQPVTCAITTREKPIEIQATFAPRVVIKDGIAIDASPGLAGVTGVNGYLAWPVVEYVNRSATVKGEMLNMINSYLSLRVARQG